MSPDVLPKPGLLNWLFLITLGVIWGSSFLAVEIALDGFGPLTIAGLRIGLGAIALTVLSFAFGHGLPSWRAPTGPRIWAHAFGFAVFTNALPFSLLSWGQQSVTSGFAGITMAVVPLMALPLAHIFVPGERMSLRKVAGFMVGFAGVVLLIGLDAFAASGAEQEALARFACVGAACCYAIGSIITRLCPPVPLLAYSAAGLTMGAALILPAALWIEGVPGDIRLLPALALVFLGVFPTALATVLLVRIINSAGPTFMTLVNYMVPIWAVVFGALILSEAVPPQFMGALALILAGLGLARAPARRFRP